MVSQNFVTFFNTRSGFSSCTLYWQFLTSRWRHVLRHSEEHAYLFLANESWDKWSAERNTAESKTDVRVLLTHFWKKMQNASPPAREFYSVEEETVDGSTTMKWLQRFRSGNTDIKDMPGQDVSRLPMMKSCGKLLKIILVPVLGAFVSPAGPFS